MATGALIGALRVTLGLDTAAFEQGATKAGRQSQKLEADVRSHMAKIESHMDRLRAAGAGLAGALTGLGIMAAVKEALDYASSLGEVAQQMGVTTKTLQEYRFIATQVGVDQETMDKGLAKLTVSIGKAASGGKAQAAAFAEMGIAVKDANGHVRTTDELLPELIGKFSAMQSPAERARLEVTLFGKAGQQLDTLLAGGIDQVDNLRNAAASLGIVLSDEQIQSADRTADKLAELKTVLAANIAGAVADNAGSIYSLVTALEKLIGVLPYAINGYNRLKSAIGMGVGVAAGVAGLATGSDRLTQWGRGTFNNQQQAFGAAWNNVVGQKTWMDKQRDSIAQWARTTGGGRGGAVVDPDGGETPRASRGGGGRSGGRPARSAETTLQQTLDSLLPDDTERRRLAEQAKQLRAALVRGGLDQATFDRAMGALGDRQDRISRTSAAPLAGNDNEGADPFGLSTKVKTELVDLKGLLDNVKTTNGELGESFADMARDGANALQGLANSIRGGGLLDILGGVLDAFLTLGSSGLLGGKIQTNLKSGLAGARAMGGPVDGGRTYLVGERGPELFTAPGAGRIIPNGAFGGGSPVSFDLRGAVMTADLVQQMQLIANDTGGRIVTANNATLMKRSRQRLGR